MKIIIFTFLVIIIGCSQVNIKESKKDFETERSISSEKKDDYYADVIIIHTSGSALSPENLKEQFDVAKKIYSAQGVHLNLKDSYKIDIPPSWHTLTASDIRGRFSKGPIDFYDKITEQEKWLSQRAIKIFRKIIGNRTDTERTLFLISLNNVSMKIFKKNKEGDNIPSDYLVGALSFPGYIYADRIPSDLRGIITLGRVPRAKWTTAHELAHKLINASHEGDNACPKFSGNQIPGILGYTGDTTIYSGKKGRWHLERLKRSPFLYKIKDGKKQWNNDYVEGGAYRDPIYDPYFITPACP